MRRERYGSVDPDFAIFTPSRRGEDGRRMRFYVIQAEIFSVRRDPGTEDAGFLLELG